MKAKLMTVRNNDNVRALKENEEHLNPVFLAVLANRGVNSHESLEKYLHGSLKDLYDPRQLKDFDKVATLLADAISANKKIAVYGDYDVDGVFSTVIFYKTLQFLGGTVVYHIPDREKEGYGMNSTSIETLHDQGVDVILTCDNGIAAPRQIALAKSLGMQVLVTDHHIPQGELDADAVVDPKQEDCSYPCDALCGTGIALKFGMYFCADNPSLCNEFLQLAALATVADVVPLVDENRIIVKEGLALMNSKDIAYSLKLLATLTNLADKEISSYHLGFILGPTINAAGRLKHAKLAVEFFLEPTVTKAENLIALNKERQKVTEECVDSLKSTDILRPDEKVIICFDDNVPSSVAGIVASRLTEHFYRPTILFSKTDAGLKGSGRSIPSYNLFEGIKGSSQFLESFGGHEVAAGMTILAENLEAFRKDINEKCTLTEQDLTPIINIDAVVQPESVTKDLTVLLESLRPFGRKNPTPTLFCRKVKVFKMRFLGEDHQVVKFVFKTNAGFLDGITFDGFDDFKGQFVQLYDEDCFQQLFTGEKWFPLYADIVFCPTLNEYNGKVSVQLKLSYFRLYREQITGRRPMCNGLFSRNRR